MPTALRAAEWVGPVVLVFVGLAAWGVFRGSEPRGQASPARPAGIGALCGIVLGVWIGSALHPIPGVVLLVAGCGLSLWSALQLLGVTWRNHVRPSTIPLVLAGCIAGLGWFWPRTMALAVLLIGAWAVASIRIALAEADTLLKHVLTRTLVLKHFEPAAYFVRLWFARLVQRPDLTLLLALGHQAAKALHVLPRVRSVAIATTSLQLVTDMADEVLERRLRTDGASGRTTSWVRILTRRFFRGFVRKSGAAAAAQLLSAVLLAVPPSREQAWSDKPQQSLEASPDIDEYLKIVLSGLPVQADESALQRIQEQLHSDGSRAGIDWFTAVATRAEEWRQEALPPHRDCRIEMLGEVVWGVYENAVGPRPPQYDIYDQLRLQLPDLLEGLAVRDVEIDGDTLSLSLRGLPSSFHDLTFGVGRHRTGADLALETRDGQSWRFERLEAGDGRAVHVVFRTVKQ